MVLSQSAGSPSDIIQGTVRKEYNEPHSLTVHVIYMGDPIHVVDDAVYGECV